MSWVWWLFIQSVFGVLNTNVSGISLWNIIHSLRHWNATILVSLPFVKAAGHLLIRLWTKTEPWEKTLRINRGPTLTCRNWISWKQRFQLDSYLRFVSHPAQGNQLEPKYRRPNSTPFFGHRGDQRHGSRILLRSEGGLWQTRLRKQWFPNIWKFCGKLFFFFLKIKHIYGLWHCGKCSSKLVATSNAPASCLTINSSP